MEIQYRRFYRRLKTKFPYIEHQLNQPGQIKSPSEIPELYAKFKELYAKFTKRTAVTDYEIRKNNDDLLFIFVSVIALMGDQFYFEGDAPLRKGFRRELSLIFDCDPTTISHALNTAKIFYSTYPEFMDQVKTYYNKMAEG